MMIWGRRPADVMRRAALAAAAGAALFPVLPGAAVAQQVAPTRQELERGAPAAVPLTGQVRVDASALSRGDSQSDCPTITTAPAASPCF